MGVDLSGLLQSEEVKLASLSMKSLAVDAFNTIFQFLSIIRQYDGTPLMDSKGRITSHLSGLFYRNVNLMKQGVRLVYVFDGRPPSFKIKTIESREKRKEVAKKKYEQALKDKDYASARKYASQTAVLTDDMINDAKKLLQAMGIPVIQAPSEGEAQCAHLALKRKVYAVASQDYDSLLFGAPILVRNINITGKRKLPNKEQYVYINPEKIELESNLKRLGLTREQLVVLSLFLGTDYNEGVKGIGVKKAYTIVKENKVEDVIDKYGFDRKIVEWFLHPKVKDVSFKFGNLNRDEIVKILVDEHDFSEERVNRVLDDLESVRRSGAQTDLSRFM
ncbi:MAG TPA: flap endonuclease-1 [Candidatus Aenigmarchaeota archaeon]|nr:MAG: flap endonuclease-1 [Nanoarchaeota archaeon]HDO79858.1 flap endonuclease-1 [Candidatus Aenigmarchaeota archaeon]HEX32910.1 flap endonuclease-1 [Candidatus Aenigmarchaeota archaeon]